MVTQHLKEFVFCTVQKEEYKEKVRECHRNFRTMTGQREDFSSCKEHQGVMLGLVHYGCILFTCAAYKAYLDLKSCLNVFLESQNLTKVNRQLHNTFTYFIWQEASSDKSRQKIMKALKIHIVQQLDNGIITDSMAECLTASMIVS